MSIRRGDVVTHSEAAVWGVGKVVEVTSQRISIQFNDGTIRKIASPHFKNLQQAEPGLFVPAPDTAQKVPAVAVARRTKRAKA